MDALGLNGVDAALFVLSIQAAKPHLGADYEINISVSGAASQVGCIPHVVRDCPSFSELRPIQNAR